MKTTISILVLLLFISVNIDARGVKGGKGIFSKSADRIIIKPLDLNWEKKIPIVIPDNCKKQLDEKTELTEDCKQYDTKFNDTPFMQGEILNPNWTLPIPEGTNPIKIQQTNIEDEQSNELPIPETISNLNFFLIGLIIFLVLASGFIVMRFLRQIK